MNNTYIHFTEFNLETIENILKNGIMSKYTLEKNGIYKNVGIGSNGKYYISLTKANNSNGIFKLLKNNPNFIGFEIMSNTTIKAKKSNCFLFINTKLPIRCSIYDDEWQTMDTILPNDFVSLYYPLDFIYTKYNNDLEYLKIISKKIADINKLMQQHNINIPINTNEKVYLK